MEQRVLRTNSKIITLIALFAALEIACDIVVIPSFSAGIWFGWIFILSPIAGIVLGPYNGFISTFIGVMIGHWIVPRESMYEFIFTIGAPIGSMISGFIFQKKLNRVFIFYTAMILLYFLTPVSWFLPIWGIWDCLAAYIVLMILGLYLSFRGSYKTQLKSPFMISAFLGLEADILFRIAILIPFQGYNYFYGLTPEALIAVWTIPAPLITPFKVLLSMLVSKFIGPKILQIAKQLQV
jgi:hypothetical protein